MARDGIMVQANTTYGKDNDEDEFITCIRCEGKGFIAKLKNL
jgi:hypothetical protein